MSPTRKVPDAVCGVVDAVADRLPQQAGAELRSQVRRAAVTGEKPGRMLGLKVSGKPRLTLPDGPLTVVPAVREKETCTGEVLVWVRSGRLVGVERTWFTDTAPTAWPAPDDLDFG